MSQKNEISKSRPLVEKLDYYIENGYWVFTEHYHRQRGYCCGSGCRHCPYANSKKKVDNPPKQG